MKKNKCWYKKGLPFSCTGCGDCCTGEPGYVWVSEEEVIAISQHLKMTDQEFCDRYLRSVDGRWALRENKISSDQYDCVFLKNKKCTIYPIRPTQCKTFPWWPQHLESEEHWEQTAKTCEGIYDDAPLVSEEEVQKQLKNYLKSYEV